MVFESYVLQLSSPWCHFPSAFHHTCDNTSCTWAGGGFDVVWGSRYASLDEVKPYAWESQILLFWARAGLDVLWRVGPVITKTHTTSLYLHLWKSRSRDGLLTTSSKLIKAGQGFDVVWRVGIIYNILKWFCLSSLEIIEIPGDSFLLVDEELLMSSVGVNVLP